jgi:hypothetical protein
VTTISLFICQISYIPCVYNCFKHILYTIQLLIHCVFVQVTLFRTLQLHRFNPQSPGGPHSLLHTACCCLFGDRHYMVVEAINHQTALSPPCIQRLVHQWRTSSDFRLINSFSIQSCPYCSYLQSQSKIHCTR